MIVVWVQTLLAFVNFKLYHSINVKYPPILDPQLEASAAGMLLLLLLLSFSSRVGEGDTYTCTELLNGSCNLFVYFFHNL